MSSSSGTVYNSIGRVYRAHGRFDEALRFQLKALSLHEKGGSAFELMQSLNAVATVYERLDDYEERRELLRAGAGHRREIELASASRICIRANFSSLLIAPRRVRARRQRARAGARPRRGCLPGRRQKMLSLAYSKMDRPQRCARRGQPRRSISARETRRRASTHSDAVPPRMRRSAMRQPRSPTSTPRSSSSKGSATASCRRDFFKQDFNHAQQYIYSQAIALQVQQKQERQALETAELARSRAFLDLLASRDVQVKERDRPLIARCRSGALLRASRIDLQAVDRQPPSGSDAPWRCAAVAASTAGRPLAISSSAASSPRRPSAVDGSRGHGRPPALHDGRLLGWRRRAVHLGRDARRRRSRPARAGAAVAAARAHSRDRRRLQRRHATVRDARDRHAR